MDWNNGRANDRLARDIPDRFSLVFKADDAHIPCHVVWRQEERIGVAFD
jgi:hypothetical protein